VHVWLDKPKRRAGIGQRQPLAMCRQPVDDGSPFDAEHTSDTMPVDAWIRALTLFYLAYRYRRPMPSDLTLGIARLNRQAAPAGILSGKFISTP
jgi:hypothetical protein